jgi:PKD repeat protein
MVLNLTGSSHVEVGCLAVTDHSGCVEFHSGSAPCQRDTPPFGPWAVRGLYAEDSTDVFLHDLHIHGLAAAGIHAGRLRDWRVEDVSVIGNGMVGWDGDIEGDDSNSGDLAFRRFRVEWNGCAETYPGAQPTGCWAQSAGGYGDGFGTGATRGTWLFEDSTFLHNTSDGLDLLYARSGSSITLRRVHSEGNAGDQIKTNGPVTIENTIAVSSCGSFEGQPYTHHVDPCRAGGTAVVLVLREGAQANVTNSTVAGEGDGLVLGECDSEHSSCNGQEQIVLRNNVFVGVTEFLDSGDIPSLIYQETFPQGDQLWDVDYSVARHVKGACPGAHSSCGEAPAGLFDEGIDTFDAHLLPTSPARDAGSAAAAPAVDFDGLPRDAYPDIGAYEYRVAGGGCTISCTATVPGTATVGTPVAFQATATLSGCAGSATYAWSFGDGTPGSTQQNPSHTYATAGTFPYTLTVSADGQTCARNGSVTVSSAPVLPFVYVVPAVTHSPGLLSTTWRSDVAAVNLGGGAARLALTFVPLSGAPVSLPGVLPASATREYADVLSSFFGYPASAVLSGALQVASDKPLLLSSRTFNQGASGTFGGFVPALSASGGLGPGQVGYLPQLRRSPAYRTNIGVTNLGTSTVRVTLRLYGASGAPVGSPTVLDVPAGGLLQATDVFATSGAGDQAIAFATVETQTPAARVWAYASVIDNATGDPTIVPLTVP